MDDTMLSLAPMLIAVAAGFATLIADAFGSRRAAVTVAAVTLTVATAAGVFAVVRVTEATLVYGVFVAGGGFAAVVAFVVGLSAVSLIGGWRAFAERPGGGTAAALVAFSAAAACALSQSLDLVMTLIALETMAACAYGLVSGARTPRSDEAAMKYLIQGAVSTGLVVLGTAILVGLFGAGTGYQGIAMALASNPLLPATAAASLILAAFAFKLGAAPFQWWAPDVFETAPPSASAFMATAPKLGAIAGLFIVMGAVFDGNVARLGYQVAALAVLSILVGNLAGLRQSSYTRLLGYSGIAQIGYALVGLATSAGLEAQAVLQFLPYVLVMVVSYSVAAAGAFLCADIIKDARPDWDGTVAGMAGFARQRPVVSAALGVFMFSLTGIPLTAGFWGKLLVFGAAVGTPWHGLSIFGWFNVPVGWGSLAVIGIIGSVVSFGYYGGVLRSVFFEQADAESGASLEDEGKTRGGRMGPDSVVVVMLALIILAAGIAPLFTGVEVLVRVFGG